MAIKRYFYLWHRWLGIVLCLFMALWFISGVVMMYVGYPKLTAHERLQHLPELDVANCCASLQQVLAAGEGVPDSLRLVTVAGAPRFLLGQGGRAPLVLDARSGAPVGAADQALALASARQFQPQAEAHYLGQVDEDPWTHSRALDADRPLHRVQLDDEEGRLLYISSRSGEVVRDATATERAWNWLGAWLHWLYPLRGGLFDGAWAHIVIYLSLAATLMAALGLAVGLLRWRFRGRYRSGAKTPYQGFARWHHVGGLLFGVLAITWIFSGLMSMNPWGLFSSRAPLALGAYAGGPLRAEAFPVTVEHALADFRAAGLRAREVEWRMIGGQGYLVAYDGAGRTLVRGMADGRIERQLPRETLEAAARAIHPQGQMTSELLADYDFYYYARTEHSMLGHLDKRLPVLRVRFDDPARTWVHLDLYTGAVQGSLDQPRRASRWLFALLHSWDWLPLLGNRPLWDGWMLLFSAGGLLVCMTGMVLGGRRLMRRSRVAPSRRPRKPAALEGNSP